MAGLGRKFMAWEVSMGLRQGQIVKQRAGDERVWLEEGTWRQTVTIFDPEAISDLKQAQKKGALKTKSVGRIVGGKLCKSQVSRSAERDRKTVNEQGKDNNNEDANGQN
ncbi:hypothetical protein F7725_009660 [Dissostichus mawsoni]|uniref:Uncharacterized protein n=1 Tax=Dissostichus mawsoni TaxID=36200 RepID=A0A7J5XLD3_DISMA|nr:hypothetical protein F7725_009660 [Dissostichus mawsoni]